LLHVPIGGRVVNLGARVAEGPLAQLAVSFVALLVTLVSAGVFWYFVERPFMRAARKIGARPPAMEKAWVIG
jgi:peptidoglycan/LPS O-acetylase OafA/YrhL